MMLRYLYQSQVQQESFVPDQAKMSQLQQLYYYQLSRYIQLQMHF